MLIVVMTTNDMKRQNVGLECKIFSLSDGDREMIRNIKDCILENWDCLLTVALIIMVALMSGCAVNDPIGQKYQPTTAPGKLIVNDLRAASMNLNSAVRVGALTADDPAPACVQNALNRFGDGQETFEPELAGVVSLSSVAYIRARQLENRAPVSTECKALLGDILLRRLD